MSNQNDNPFIKNIHLKGFKSVKDLDVRLNNGLNIVIGENGSGKTNFVEFLKKTLGFRRNDSLKTPYFAEIIFQTPNGDKKFTQNLENKHRRKDFEMDYTPIEVKFVDLRSNTEYDFSDSNLFLNLNKSNSIELARIFVYTSISYKSEPFEETFMFSELGEITIDSDTFLWNILPNIFEKKMIELETYQFYELDKIVAFSNKINDYLSIDKKLLENLKLYSPIKGMRLSESMKVSIIPRGVKLEYLMLEFFVNGTWLKWNQLSDGTRRIFDIIYQVMQNGSNLILIEEPENGVHPDQLYKLMDFFKEQAKEKQIIITTHSPEVLNILEKDELDRIIVTRFDGEKGTKMHHLSEKTKKKALWYMENKGMLSDCWVHTKSFEKYDEADANA